MLWKHHYNSLHRAGVNHSRPHKDTQRQQVNKLSPPLCPLSRRRNSWKWRSACIYLASVTRNKWRACSYKKRSTSRGVWANLHSGQRSRSLMHPGPTGGPSTERGSKWEFLKVYRWNSVATLLHFMKICECCSQIKQTNKSDASQASSSWQHEESH